MASSSWIDDDNRRDLFLEALAVNGTPRTAARDVGVSMAQVYAARRNNEDFRALYAEAMETYRESLLAEATRRARDGVKEAIFYRGVQARVIDPTTVDLPEDERKYIPAFKVNYSDTLLLALLRAHYPQFADKSSSGKTFVEKEGGQGAIERLTPKELDRLEQFILEARGQQAERVAVLDVTQPKKPARFHHDS